MAESEKSTAPVKSKEKSSLLGDLDIDKDFLGSWKSMDDGMDFDFEPTTKGNKKAFKFDNMDMDFSLDADFGKPFKMDMTGLDVSSPTKKSGKSKEKTKEVSSGGENQSKRDSFGFSFDFSGFGLDFESKKKKTDDNSNKSKDKEGQSNAGATGGSEDFFTKNVDASVSDDISSHHPTARGVAISKVDTRLNNSKGPDPMKEDDHMKSVTDESCHLNNEKAKEREIQRTITPEKIISCNVQEPMQESHSSEKRCSPEPFAQKVVQDSPCHSEAHSVSTEGILSDMQEEESRTIVRMVSPGTGDEQNGNVRPMAESVPTAHVNSQTQTGEMCEEGDDNVLIGYIDGDDTSKADSHPESSLVAGIENLVREEMVDKRNADSFSRLQVDSLSGGTKINKLASEKERKSIPIRSKYFVKQNESESELKQASVSSTKLISIGNKRMSTIPNNPAPEKRDFGSRGLESASKYTGISRILPKGLSRDTPVQTENTEAGHVKGVDNTRESLNAGKIKPRNEPVVSTVTHDIVPTKQELVSKGGDQNTEHVMALRSDVHPSSSVEQTKKSLSQKGLTTGLQLTSMASTLNTRKVAVDKNRISPSKAETRATEQKLKPLNSLVLKGLTSMRNKEKDQELQGNMVKRNPSVDTKKQTPSTPSLKRKASEEYAELPRLSPLKRLSPSPRSNIRAPSERVIDEQICNHASVTDGKSPRLDLSQIDMDMASTIENDSIFEKAEACSKELDDICNMLKKKHEEAKDLLVRSIVNNNNLLMLNHPVHQEKLRMVQKFAAMLITK